ncbi:MAG: GNAT family N-acetyltransferase [Pseudomonadota bacterium]
MLPRLLRGISRKPNHFVCEVEADDLARLAELHAQGFSRGWSDGELAKLMANKAYFCLVMRPRGENNTQPVAFVLVRVAAEEAEIITIATHNRLRRSGFARRLMEAVIRKLESDRAKRLFLEVDENNKAAISLYHQLGFKKISERTAYYNGDGDNVPSSALVMQRELG